MIVCHVSLQKIGHDWEIKTLLSATKKNIPSIRIDCTCEYSCCHASRRPVSLRSVINLILLRIRKPAQKSFELVQLVCLGRSPFCFPSGYCLAACTMLRQSGTPSRQASLSGQILCQSPGWVSDKLQVAGIGIQPRRHESQIPQP
jgi:hypothetical protein